MHKSYRSYVIMKSMFVFLRQKFCVGLSTLEHLCRLEQQIYLHSFIKCKIKVCCLSIKYTISLNTLTKKNPHNLYLLDFSTVLHLSPSVLLIRPCRVIYYRVLLWIPWFRFDILHNCIYPPVPSPHHSISGKTNYQISQPTSSTTKQVLQFGLYVFFILSRGHRLYLVIFFFTQACFHGCYMNIVYYFIVVDQKGEWVKGE